MYSADDNVCVSMSVYFSIIFVQLT